MCLPRTLTLVALVLEPEPVLAELVVRGPIGHMTQSPRIPSLTVAGPGVGACEVDPVARIAT
ncbi:hypothetical protein [Streptomyces beihaiensis]|uniref:Uncharacterized protein n=1 Tax=Streptomyces beihaiensis TaxID=2984495 RepID=A0ABT3TPG5_9ACTN|nr:hypothetical protein [Streptomyces beihaiensis]MCX3058896.1 hypothetical protein [Streptomyces beihaiensis]